GVALVYDGTSVKPAFTPTNFNGKAVNLWRIGGEGSNAWTGGSDGAVFKLSSGGSWRSQIPYESQGLTFTDAWAADASTAYVVLGGLAAGVWKHDASGFNQVVMPTETLTAIWGSSASDVWVTARDGKMLHYDGSSWETKSVGQAGTDYRAIWGSGASDIWALTRTSAMHYDGSQWTQSALAADQSLNAIWGSAADDIWAVGDASTIMHYDGSAWTKQ
ncbi:MAG: hypothetical protein KC503_36485, partial [Myxococcales bacterium]|nr:hypothetical protein [Myxococcales bacterium]